MDDLNGFGGAMRPVVFAVATFFASAAVSAATLTAVNGTVMVNTGASYAPAQVGANLAENHRLMVLANSTATIEYESCALSVSANQVIAVGTEQDCRARLSYAPGDPAGGGGGAGGGAATATSVATTTTATTVTTASLVAGATVAVTAAGVIGKGVNDMDDASR
jgi:hypothetical protein